ncbi:MAG: DUF362 domain-containing protein [Syntrophorhabdales bacterium]|jgi:uncharacterized protein (DUF362 family)
MSVVTLVGTKERKKGVIQSIKSLGINPVRGKDVFVKPNFNTADPVPGSTHNDTLEALVEELWAMGAKSISLGDRSFPPTREVMEAKGVLPLLERLNVTVIDFDSLPEKDWVLVKPKASHWKAGFRVARPVLEAECLVSTCCLKTHQYGGVFSMSLKLAVGTVPTTRQGFSYMNQLHSSMSQRKMIAEINVPFTPALVVLDGIDIFTDGGPVTGTRAKADLFLASIDRVAIDAVAVAVLKSLGSNNAIMKPRIFEQEQIARAAELGLGASSPTEIDLKAADVESNPLRDRIAAILAKG